MNTIEKLIAIFSQFPGIGPRQARRFVYYLLTRNPDALFELSKNIAELKNEISICSECKRFFANGTNKPKPEPTSAICKICSNPERNRNLLMVVQRDVDLETIEKNGSYDGLYFVLGGSIPVLEKEPEKRVRIKELLERVESLLKTGSLEEIIIATNWNPEGENTSEFIKKSLETFRLDTLAQSPKKRGFKISTLGKGLSMGTELEYTDKETMKNALRNRS